MAPSIQSRRESLEDLLAGLNAFERKHAPKDVYLAGDVTLLGAPSVSVIGARTASSDGLKRTRKLCRELVGNGFTIVSGLALGVDTVAHTTAIESRGRTIAVLGTALDDCYPRENLDLQQRIMIDHLAISQFAPGTPTRRTNFPRRNRTMALVSDATVIVEAGETSGTLSQGWEALRLGRPLFIMKSVMDTDSLKWPKEMLNYGARLLAEVEDLLLTLPPVVSPNVHVEAAII